LKGRTEIVKSERSDQRKLILKFVNKVTEKLHKEKHLFSNNKPDYWQKNCRNCTKSIFLKKLFANNCAM